MDSAVTSLELEFKKLSADLQFIVHRLEADFTGTGGKSVAGRGDINPLKTCRRISQLQSGFSTLSKRCSDVASRKLELVSELESYCSEIQSNLSDVSAKAIPGADEESAMCLSAFKQIADTIRAGPVAAAAPAVDDTVEEAVPALPLRSKPVNVIATETGLLDSAAFEGVPPSIRGRCKFDDVVKTYAVIKSYYADEPSTTKSRSVKKAWSIPKAILTVGASEKLGAKVSGLSGKCVLNTLRHLGFITISSEGISLPIPSKKRKA